MIFTYIYKVMIIPVRCFTCGKVLADKYNTYIDLVKQHKTEMDLPNEDTILKVSNETITETPEGQALDKLKLTRYCCRRMMLGHINLIDVV